MIVVFHDQHPDVGFGVAEVTTDDGVVVFQALYDPKADWQVERARVIADMDAKGGLDHFLSAKARSL